MNIPCKSGEYQMPPAVIDSYRLLYPSADYEFAQMVIWLETHPMRRPASPKSAPRFVANWFKRVPRISPRAQEKLDTLAALTGRSMNVVPIGRSSNRPPVRQNVGGMGRAEDVEYVDWCEPGRSAAHLGADTLALPAASTAGSR